MKLYEYKLQTTKKISLKNVDVKLAFNKCLLYNHKHGVYST